MGRLPAGRLELFGRRDRLPFGRQRPGVPESLAPAALGPVTDARLLGGLVAGGGTLDDELGGLPPELRRVPFLSCTLACPREFLSCLRQPRVSSSPRAHQP